MERRRLAAHWQILIGMVAGLLVGMIAVRFGGKEWVVDWLKPLGTIFINLLKLIAIPMIITSLITGMANLGDVSRLSRLGLQTVMLYLATTVIAISIGLLIANVVKPGDSIAPSTRNHLVNTYQTDADAKIQTAKRQRNEGPLKPLVAMVPDNIFLSATSNRNMLQVIFVVILFSIGLLMVAPEHQQPIKSLFEAFNGVVMKLVDVIMLFAPLGVFALLASLVAEIPSAALCCRLARR